MNTVIYGILVVSMILLITLIFTVGPILNKSEHKKESKWFSFIIALLMISLMEIFLEVTYLKKS